jgi:tRNA-uridine 2-sulfurtransferase
MKNKNKRVLVGLSGGVDSSVACLLLQNQGYRVEAVFIKVWQPEFIECNWREEMRDAMRICAKLKVPFHFLDLENEYKKDVADYFVEEYKNGRTPNPDVMCNKHIKFGYMFQYAEKNNFDYVATGHYAITKNGKLYRGKDKNKDQSYFLWTLTEDKLKKILFPIGDLEKSEVRKIADSNGLFTSEKKDSQGVCILGPVDMKDFLKNFIDIKKGKVLNKKGEVIGNHNGAVLYTIGERHGFEIEKKHKTINDQIMYVLSKNVEKNTITVGDIKNLKINKIEVSDISFVDKTEYNINSTLEIEFQTRYRQKPQKGFLKGNELKANFLEIPAIGQSIVFYQKDKCAGGGIINKII